ncbi:CHAT domain-containing protein [Roseibium sp.]|uniref:CHAT domain-containing protein n=1 Tax=Roseibium sp. TaxID=1936156 RepID=UPI003BB07918
MKQSLQVIGDKVCRFFGEAAPVALGLPLAVEEDTAAVSSVLVALLDWKNRYSLASVRNDAQSLTEIGTEMFAWLNTAGALGDWMRQSERVLQILPDDGSNPDLASALMEAPWEVLFDKGFLAGNNAQLFVVSRRVMKATSPWQPQHGDLRMIFMAAAPEGQSELDFEAEEVSISEATGSAAGSESLVHLIVEESGTLKNVSERLAGRDGAFEVLHLSCHGDFVAPRGIDGMQQGSERPVLLLETEEGAVDEISALDLINACQNRMPPLVFVSACRTAQFNESGSSDSAMDMHRIEVGSPASREAYHEHIASQAEVTEPFVLDLVRGVGNVLGWDGLVYDHDAASFASSFYSALSRGEDVPKAAAMARRDLLREGYQDPENGRHWHLARVYLGAEGGGPICAPGKGLRDAPVSVPAFLDSDNKIKVAGRETFVGRRRIIQKAIATLRKGGHGLLAHGIGNLGKSSLAARIAERLTGYQTVVVVSPKAELGSANGRVIFEKLKSAVNKMTDALPFGSEEARSLKSQIEAMETSLAKDPKQFADILRALLAGPFKTAPIFLVLDDFENSLETPTAEAPMPQPKQHLLEDLQALFRAFAVPGTSSRLMVTCRYDFCVPDTQGNDLTDPFLDRIPLPPMKERERRKQWQARERARRTDQGETAEAAARDRALLERILTASGGNPGLQEVLTEPFLRGATDEVTDALTTIEAFLKSGETPPEGEDIGDFFARMTFEVYRDALDEITRRALAVASTFSPGVPIPVTALEAGMEAMEISAPNTGLKKLQALGLLDDHGLQAGWPRMTKIAHVAVNPLARPLADELGSDDQQKIAQAALPLLAKAWQGKDGDFPYDLRAVEVTLQSLKSASSDGELLDAAARSAVFFLFEIIENALAAVALAEPVFARLEAINFQPSAFLLGRTIKAADRIGAVELQDLLLSLAVGRKDIEERSLAQLKGLQAYRQMRKGDLNSALRITTEEELPVYEALGDKRSIAVTKGQIADILQAQGDLDGALRIREEEQLPVFEALGDTRSIAVTQGKIADILQMRGDLDGALRIREEEQLPVFEALGDTRSTAVTQGQIADILQIRGDLDGALRIREEEQLPVYEALGDTRSIAVTQGKIADILQMRGDLDGALRISVEEELPVYEALGDTRSIAVTQGKIADIQMRGDLDGALRIREEEQLPVFEALGDKREFAVTQSKIADILQLRGDLDGALRIREEEQLPVFEALGDKREFAVTQGKIADILQMRGDLDGALALHLERLPVAEAMRDLDSVMHIRYSCAQIRLARGDLQKGEAQTIFEELDEAFRGALKLQRSDAIGAIGPLLAQVLAGGGATAPALDVLDISEQAFNTLKDEEGLAHVAELRSLIGQGDDPDT